MKNYMNENLKFNNFNYELFAINIRFGSSINCMIYAKLTEMEYGMK